MGGCGLVPAGLRLRSDDGTRLHGGVLVGGSPTRVLRLTGNGARQVESWLAGRPVGDSAAARKLARRLLDAGIAHPDLGTTWPGAPAPADVTVVIPVRDRYDELARCLGGLITARGARHPVREIIVVDDCSDDPAGIEAAAARAGARVIRRPVNGGPGAARNTGLAAASTELVAFLDSDCVPSPGWLDALLPHFADPAVGAVAPRIVPAQPGRSWLARYEGAASTLDMGARPSIVAPGARVSYVPGATLVVRRGAAGAGFAPGMQVGEDVDFVWRLAAAGWRVRYEPRPGWATSTGCGCARGCPVGPTTGPRRPSSKASIPARSGRCRPPGGRSPRGAPSSRSGPAGLASPWRPPSPVLRLPCSHGSCRGSRGRAGRCRDQGPRSLVSLTPPSALLVTLVLPGLAGPPGG